MALPIDVTDPGMSNAESQAFGTGLPVQVNQNTVATQATSAISANNVRGDEAENLGQTTQVTPGSVVAGQRASAAVTTVNGGSARPGLGIAATVNDPGMSNAEAGPVIGLGLPAELDGDASRPGRTPVDVGENDVVNQVYGTGTPRNVFV